MRFNTFKAFHRLLLITGCLFILTGCLETSIVASSEAPDDLTSPQNTNSGPLADGIINGPSGGDLTSHWRCAEDNSGESIDFGFGADGTGEFDLPGADPIGLLWAIEPVTNRLLIHLDDRLGRLWFSDVRINGNAQFTGTLVIDGTSFPGTVCNREGSASQPDRPDEEILSNGATTSNTDLTSYWTCDTGTNIGIAVAFTDNGSGLFNDSPDPDRVISIDSWVIEAGDIVIDFADGLSGGFRAYSIQDNNSFTATELLRGSSSFGTASCQRRDREGNLITASGSQN